MAEKIPTPSYGEGKSISNYEKEIAAWEIITKTARDKRGVMLALNLDENLKNRVLENVSIQDLHKDTGVQDLLIYLKKTFGKDELTDSKECYKEFRDYKRKSGQNIHDYIEEFASRVNKLQNRGVIIANEILAFELIERANITPIEEKLVSTGLDFSKKEEMYNDAKIALKKFLRETTVNKEEAACAVRVESVNEATQEVAYNNSYPRRGGYNFYQNNRSRNYQHQAGNARFNNNFQKPSIKNSRSQQNNRVENFNPRGRYGEFLLCHRCGSNRHFIKNCPRKENSFITLCEEDEKENTLTFEQIKESPVLVLEHKDKTLSIEARGCAVIDTACASTVAGEDWFEDYVKNHLTPEDRKKIVKKEGKRIFRFGAGPPIKSIAEVVMPAFVAGMRVSLVADIVRNDIPLLLSITSIKNANGIIFTNNSVISLFGKKIHCLESSTGHWMMPLVEEIKIKDVCVVDINTIGGDEIKVSTSTKSTLTDVVENGSNSSHSSNKPLKTRGTHRRSLLQIEENDSTQDEDESDSKTLQQRQYKTKSATKRLNANKSETLKNSVLEEEKEIKVISPKLDTTDYVTRRKGRNTSTVTHRKTRAIGLMEISDSEITDGDVKPPKNQTYKPLPPSSEQNHEQGAKSKGRFSNLSPQRLLSTTAKVVPWLSQASERNPAFDTCSDSEEESDLFSRRLNNSRKLDKDLDAIINSPTRRLSNSAWVQHVREKENGEDTDIPNGHHIATSSFSTSRKTDIENPAGSGSDSKVSVILLALAAGFFLIVGCVYFLNIKNKSVAPSPKGKLKSRIVKSPFF